MYYLILGVYGSSDILKDYSQFGFYRQPNNYAFQNQYPQLKYRSQPCYFANPGQHFEPELPSQNSYPAFQEQYRQPEISRQFYYPRQYPLPELPNYPQYGHYPRPEFSRQPIYLEYKVPFGLSVEYSYLALPEQYIQCESPSQLVVCIGHDGRILQSGIKTDFHLPVFSGQPKTVRFLNQYGEKDSLKVISRQPSYPSFHDQQRKHQYFYEIYVNCTYLLYTNFQPKSIPEKRNELTKK